MKFEKEITVEVSCNIEELLKILKENDFELKEVYDVNDIYMIDKKYKNIEDKLELLKHTILIRDIIEENKETKQITYKYKEYDENGNITKQGKTNCKINSIEEAVNLFNALGYEKLININDHLLVYDCNGDIGSYLNPDKLRDLTKLEFVSKQYEIVRKSRIRALEDLDEFYKKYCSIKDELDYLTLKCSGYEEMLTKARKNGSVGKIKKYVHEHGNSSLDINLRSASN